MKRSRRAVKTVLRALVLVRDDRRAATAIEYGLIAAIIVVGLIASLTGLGNVTSGIWNNVSAKVGAVTPQ